MSSRVVVVGSGGREHALADVLGRTAEVVVTPGNAGIAGSTSVPPDALEADLFVIGPEAPLVDGLADRLRSGGARVFGPDAAGAMLEGSKAWMKELLDEAGVPTARYGAFTDVASATRFLDTMGDLFVVKTDGLAAGKGVTVTESRRDAEAAVRDYLSGEAFGEAGRTVVIEEGLVGPELSVLAVCDGVRALALPPAQDFKRIGEDDTGLNTGGMGAYSPVPLAGADLLNLVMHGCVEPTLAALRARGIDYRGVLYAGLMLTPEGPKVLEYNVRFGDPEAQVVLPQLTTDLVDVLGGAADGRVPDHVETAGSWVTVVCASEGYPTAPRTGDPIDGLDAARGHRDVSVFCAGVDAGPDGSLVTAGGRVLSVTARGESIADARSRAYDAVAEIDWPGMYVRPDIASGAAAEEAEAEAVGAVPDVGREAGRQEDGEEEIW